MFEPNSARRLGIMVSGLLRKCDGPLRMVIVGDTGDIWFAPTVLRNGSRVGINISGKSRHPCLMTFQIENSHCGSPFACTCVVGEE